MPPPPDLIVEESGDTAVLASEGADEEVMGVIAHGGGEETRNPVLAVKGGTKIRLPVIGSRMEIGEVGLVVSVVNA